MDNTSTAVTVSVADLASQLFDHDAATNEHTLKSDISPSLVIVDSSMGGKSSQQAFNDNAIPTARFLNVTDDLKDKSGRFPNTFPTEQVVKDVIGNLGIKLTDNIVVYAQSGKTIGATRAFVILSSFGFENVKILDGGLSKYTELGYPTSKGEDYKGEKSELSGLKDPSENRVSVDDIVEFSLNKSDDVQLIDTRPAKSFNGDASDNIDGCRQGNIPGSINITPSELLNEDQTFKTGDALDEIIRKHNIDPTKKIIVMCRSGMQATVGVAVLQNYIGIPLTNVKLYDGSWSEYGSL